MKRPIVAAVSLLMTSAPAIAATPIVGSYLTDGGKSIVQISPCGAALCGKIVKVLKASPDGASYQGATILSGLIDAGAVWKGQIHNPGNQKSYAAKVKLNPDRTLGVEACVSVFCRELRWTTMSTPEAK